MNVICHASLPESMSISVQAVNSTAFCLANCVAEFDCITLCLPIKVYLYRMYIVLSIQELVLDKLS